MGSLATVPADQEIRTEMVSVLDTVSAMRVVDQESYNAAAAFLVAIKQKQAKVTEFFEGTQDNPGMKPKAYAAWQMICARQKEASAPLAEAERHLKLQISKWVTEQERLKREAERLERERVERERLEAMEREIEAAESEGASAEEIAAICEMPMPPVVVPAPAPTFQKAAAVSTRQSFKAEVVDLKLLCGAIARGEAPVSYVAPNMTALNQRARADGMLLRIPGVRVVADVGVAVRSKF